MRNKTAFWSLVGRNVVDRMTLVQLVLHRFVSSTHCYSREPFECMKGLILGAVEGCTLRISDDGVGLRIFVILC